VKPNTGPRSLAVNPAPQSRLRRRVVVYRYCHYRRREEFGRMLGAVAAEAVAVRRVRGLVW